MKHVRFLKIVVAALFCLCGTSSVRADDLDPKVYAAAKQLQELTHIDDRLNAMCDRQIQVFNQIFDAANPGKAAAVAELVNETFMNQFRQYFPKMMDITAREYSKFYTLSDMEQIIAFYKSPIGIKFVANSNAFQSDLLQQFVPLLKTVIADSLADIKMKAQTRGLNLPHNI